MKKVIAILKQYIGKDIAWYKIGLLLAYCAVLIFIEYRFKVKKTWLDPLYFRDTYLLYATLYYGLPFSLGAILLGIFAKWKVENRSMFVALILLIIISFSLRNGFRFHRDWIPLFTDVPFQIRISNFLFLGPIWMILPAIWWWFFDAEKRFYGCSLKHVSWSAYGWMLAFMVPLIAAASFLPDFQSYYPKARNAWAGEGAQVWHFLLYELLYGLDFVYVELFFRGFMVMALGKFIGKDAIVLTAVLYCTIHFGKPLGETISSIFGALILGSLAYETRSIVGGIIVHIGIAWLMELGGFLAWIGLN